MRSFRLLGAAALIAATQTTQAQVRCTMPNGVVITQQLGNCPQGATKAQAADGTPIALPPPPKSAAPAPKASTPKPVAATPAPAPTQAQPGAYDYARLICKAFEQSGATTCEINSNIFSDSTIETTLATTPASAAVTCKDVAASMRAKTKVFQEKNWRILIFSPFSGNRPIANCKLINTTLASFNEPLERSSWARRTASIRR